MNDNENEYPAEVTHVITADTIEVIVDLGFNVSTHIVVSVDGYEEPGSTKQRLHAIGATPQAHDLLLGQPLTVIPRKRHCYGHWYCTVKLASGADFARTMIDEGHVKQSAWTS